MVPVRPVLVAVLAALAVLALAASPARAADERPLVYLVVVDGLDGDRVDAGDTPFLSSLLARQGTYYRESRSVMIAETNPNHTAMVTGAYGARSGIPGNAFALYKPLENEDSCAGGAEDLTRKPTPTSGENANCLIAETVFAAIRRQGFGSDRGDGGLVTAFATGKPKLGRIFAGKQFAGSSAPRDVDFLWAPCAPGADDDAYCAPVSTNPISGYAMSDEPVMDAVLSTITNGVKLPSGATRRPDFTFVNLHQVDSVGHISGTATGLYPLAARQADAQIRRLVTLLQQRDEWKRTVMIVASDHSMDTTLAKTTLTNRLTSAGISSDDFLAVQNGSVDAIYLADRTSPDRFKLLARMRAALLSGGGVTEVLYREPNPEDGGTLHTLDGRHPGWHAAGERSGDLFVLAEPGMAFSDPSESSNPLPGNHGAPHTRDNTFMVLGGGDFVVRQTLDGQVGALFDDTLSNPKQAENVDPASTITSLLGLEPPRNNEGRFLAEAFALGRLPGAAKPAAAPTLRVTRRTRGRFRVSVGTDGRHAEVSVRRAGRRATRRLITGTSRRTASYRGAPRARYVFTARVRGFSGVYSDRVTKTVRARR